MNYQTNFILTIFTIGLLSYSCEKEMEESSAINHIPPDLCGESDNCDDGILDDLLKKWEPLGGDFEGLVVRVGCIDTVCTDIQFTFFQDSTYLIEMVKVYPDSMDGIIIHENETGIYYVGNCQCYQNGNWWDGYTKERNGKIYFAPDGDSSYHVDFKHFQGGMFLTTSSRDSTFLLFLD